METTQHTTNVEPKGPLTIGKIISDTSKLVQEFSREIIIITAIVYIPLNIIGEFILANLSGESSLEYFRVSSKMWTTLEMFIGIIAIMAVIVMLHNFLDKKEKMEWQDALRKSVSLWPKAFTTQIIHGILLTFLFILLIVPGIIYLVYWAFIIPIIVVLGKKNMDALEHSKKLVKGDWWKVLGWFIVLGVLTIVLGIVINIPLWFLPEHIVIDILGDTLFDLSFMFLTIGSFLIFRNLNETKGAKDVLDEPGK
ncbi:hypothetical protein HOF40_04290 [Candidatus Parcubacteria bacterium]|jgi:hypothetical protein|nr:hypothetical protein [Candidatus Parcubacteria bacterium]MBT3949282.1 hypothetical protein [Candidatus Parcubacteria bacterium]